MSKICKMRNLTLEGEIVIFKTIPITKIVFQLFFNYPKTYCERFLKDTIRFFSRINLPVR